MAKKGAKKKHKNVPGEAHAEAKVTGRTRIRLKTVKDVCRYIASCIRRAERGEGENTLYKRVMMASMLIKAMEVSEIEERLKRLEEIAEAKPNELEEQT